MKKWLCFAALLCLLLAGCTPADPAVPDEPLTEPDKEPLIEQAKELVIAENGAHVLLRCRIYRSGYGCGRNLSVFHNQSG